jgi:3-deoxy-D-manno-octulosonic-acid transferase
MAVFLDFIYLLVAAATAPWWMRKARNDWPARFGRIDALPDPRRPRLLIHAVSVGEVNLTRPLVERLAPHCDLVVSATTDTGLERAKTLYQGRAHVVRYPLDASWSVRRFLDAVRPDAVALVELELWPNFLAASRRRGIPVAVVNGRLSARSFKGYRRLRPFLGQFFRSLAFAAVQDEDYARRFRAMGVPPERLAVAGSMKWDSASLAHHPDAAARLAEAMGVDRARPLIVAGSTAPEEHALLHRATPQGVQLMCAPRKPEWFDQAAADLPGCVRRSAPSGGDPASGRFMLDTIGELRAAYDLADLVVVGRSFGELFGSDPMEPAALAKPVVIGPRVEDFRASVDALLEDDAIVQTTAAELPGVLAALLDDPARRERLGASALACVERRQGAADRHADMLLGLLGVERTP